MTPRTIYNIVAFGVLGAFLIVAFTVLRLHGHGAITSILVGLGWAVDSLGIIAGVALLLIPAHVMRLRKWILASGVTGANISPNPQALTRSRIEGALGLVLFIAVLAVLIWLPAQLDIALGRGL